MQGSDTNEDSSIEQRLAAMERGMAETQRRLTDIEQKLEQLTSLTSAQTALKRGVEMRSARSGELSSRIAQRLAKCEAAIDELTAAGEDSRVD